MRRAGSLVRRRLTAQGRDAGISLPELLVVSVVSMILMGAVGVTFSGSLKATRTANTHVAATAEGRLATDVVARRLRVAVRPLGAASVFVEARPAAVTFYAALTESGSSAPSAPSLVSYAVSGSCLTETITPPVGPVRSTCLARGEASLALAYHLVTPQPTPSEPSPSPAPAEPLPFGADGKLAEADLDRVGAVQIDLGMRDATSTSPHPVQMSTRVLLVNRMNEDLA